MSGLAFQDDPYNLSKANSGKTCLLQSSKFKGKVGQIYFSLQTFGLFDLFN